MEFRIFKLIWTIFTNVPNRKLVLYQEPAVESWSCIQKKIVRFRHIWTIDKFSYWDDGVVFTSEPFVAEETNAIEFRLILKPMKNYDVLSLEVELVSCKVQNIHVDVKACILDASKESIYTKYSNTMLNCKGSILFSPFIRKSELLFDAKSLLPNDRLTISYEGATMVNSFNMSGKGTMMCSIGSQEGELADDFEHLLETGILSDVTLCIRGKKIRAHKTILAARSRVFSAMFEHDMLERQLNTVEIEDIDCKVFMEVLRFIYTGRAKNLEVPLMLVAANKYELKKLESMCKMALFTNVSITNAIDILILADLLGNEQLKRRAIDFINLNAQTISKTKEFQSLINSHPNLIVDLYRMT